MKFSLIFITYGYAADIPLKIFFGIIWLAF